MVSQQFVHLRQTIYVCKIYIYYVYIHIYIYSNIRCYFVDMPNKKYEKDVFIPQLYFSIYQNSLTPNVLQHLLSQILQDLENCNL